MAAPAVAPTIGRLVISGLCSPVITPDTEKDRDAYWSPVHYHAVQAKRMRTFPPAKARGRRAAQDPGPPGQLTARTIGTLNPSGPPP